MDDGLSEFFDSSLFGLLIRKKRQDAGLKTVDEFSNMIKQVTGYEIKEGTLTRIESGAQEAKLSQLVAIVLTLYGHILEIPYAKPDPIFLASCVEWQEIEQDPLRGL